MAHITIFKNETIILTQDNTNGEYWLYDTTRGMNLSMKAKTETNAFVEAIVYYQKRLSKVENELNSLNNKVEDFIAGFTEDNE